MAKTAKHSDEALWTKIKAQVTKGDKGGKPGQWSARKAQLATAAYKAQGGGYEGAKTKDNSLTRWTEEDWGTKSGEESGKTGERYLPRKARDALSDADYERTTAKKRADRRKGRQFSGQPADVAEKSARYRDGGAPTKAQLYAEAKRRDIHGRSTMDKAALQKALGR
jgi:hypothetical protein